MAEPDSLGQKLGITRMRLVLIGVLGSVLIGVVLFPSGSDEPVGKLSPRKPAVPTNKSEPTASSQERRHSKRFSDRNSQPWPKADLATMASQDPFAIPASLRPPVAVPPTPVEQETMNSVAGPDSLQALLDKGVDLVLVTENGKVAVIKGKQYRIGDVIEGYRITEITPQGIIVAPEGP